MRSPFDDGALQKKVPWPEPRFTDNPDGTVTDNLTRLIWLREANCWGLLSWHDALVKCNDLKSGWCGLEDGSSAGDWRLPDRNELVSLLDIEVSGTSGLLLPEANPFRNVQAGHYWSSSSAMAGYFNQAYYMDTGDDGSGYEHKASTMNGVWPVRSANP